MVAISLYRGNLHKPPDKTRRWIMPRFSIPLKEFCALHCRRSKALSLLPCSSVSPSPTPTSATPVANPNLNPIKSDQSNQPKTKCEENPNSLLKPSTSKSVVHGDSNPLDQPPILVDEGNKAPEEVTRKEVENIAIVDPIAPAIEVFCSFLIFFYFVVIQFCRVLSAVRFSMMNNLPIHVCITNSTTIAVCYIYYSKLILGFQFVILQIQWVI